MHSSTLYLGSKLWKTRVINQRCLCVRLCARAMMTAFSVAALTEFLKCLQVYLEKGTRSYVLLRPGNGSNLISLVFSPKWRMEDRTESPPSAVKVEKHSQYSILTYFHGDINSMVDAHFSRALGNDCRDKAPAGKTKKLRKSMKSGKKSVLRPAVPAANGSSGPVQPPYGVSVHREIHPLPGVGGGHLLQATVPPRGPPELQPNGRRPRLLAVVHSQSERWRGVAVHRVLPDPGRVESHRTTVRNVPAQPAAQRTGWHGSRAAVQLQGRGASQLDGAAGTQGACGRRHGFQTR